MVLLLPIEAEKNEPRLEYLKLFLKGRPAVSYCQEFLDAADSYHLDWRLLPAISVVESSGGKHARNFNWFGWNSGRAKFTDPEQAIYTVAYSLGTTDRYRSLTPYQAMHRYNPYHGYAEKVQDYMSQIDEGYSNKIHHRWTRYFFHRFRKHHKRKHRSKHHK